MFLRKDFMQNANVFHISKLDHFSPHHHNYQLDNATHFLEWLATLIPHHCRLHHRFRHGTQSWCSQCKVNLLFEHQVVLQRSDMEDQFQPEYRSNLQMISLVMRWHCTAIGADIAFQGSLTDIRALVFDRIRGSCEHCKSTSCSLHCCRLHKAGVGDAGRSQWAANAQSCTYSLAWSYRLCDFVLFFRCHFVLHSVKEEDPVWFLTLIESEGASIAVIQHSMRCEMVAHLMVMFACGDV